MLPCEASNRLEIIFLSILLQNSFIYAGICTLNSAACPNNLNPCTPCSSSSQCFCSTSPNCISGDCVPCSSSSTCSQGASNTPICVSPDCSGCTSNIQCYSNYPQTPVCNGGPCGPCVTNEECLALNPNTPICNAGPCGPCTSDAQCMSISLSTPICMSGPCVPCSENSQCYQISVLTPICLYGPCGPCSSNFQCQSFYYNLPICKTNGECVACNSNTECNHDFPNTPICSSASGACICTSSSQCKDPNMPICFEPGICSPCLNSSQCKSDFPEKPICLPLGACAPCQNNLECQSEFADFPICKTNGECIPCLTNEECFPLEVTPLCINEACLPCQTNLECIQAFPYNQFCVANGSCVPCNSNSECNAEFPGLSPICSLLTGPQNLCVQCEFDSDCAVFNFAFCVNFTCHECRNNSDCLGKPGFNNPFCNISYSCDECTTGYPVCYACRASQNCNITTYYANCTSENVCVPCQFDNDCSYLPDYPNCVKQSNGEFKCSSLIASFQDEAQWIYPDLNNFVNLYVSSTTPNYTIYWNIEPLEDSIEILEFDSTSINVEATDYTLIISAMLINSFGDTANATTIINILPTSQQNQIYNQIVRIIAYIIVGCIIFSLSTGSSSLGILNLTRLLFYVLFFNVNYPPELNEFLTMLTSFNLFFIPNPFTWPGFSNQASPQKFYDHKYGGLFLVTVGSNLFVMILLFIQGWVGKLLLRLNIANRKIREFLFQVSKNATLNGFLSAWIETSAEIVLASLVQIRSPEFSNGFFGISFIFGISSLFFHFYVLKLIKKKLNEFTIQSKEPEITSVAEVLSHLSANTWVNINLPLIILLKFCLNLMTLVFFYSIPILQVFSSLLFQIIYLVLIIWRLPWKRRVENLFYIVQESLLLLVFIMVLVMAISEQNGMMDYQLRSRLGYVIIACISIILFQQLALNFRLFYHKFCKRKGINHSHQLTYEISGLQKRKVRRPKTWINQQRLKIAESPSYPSTRKIKRFQLLWSYIQYSYIICTIEQNIIGDKICIIQTKECNQDF